MCRTVSRGNSYPPKLRSEWGAVVFDWCIENISKTRTVSMNLSRAWNNSRERVWMTYTPLLVLSSQQLGHRDCILNLPQHYNYQVFWVDIYISGFLIFTLISVRWISMQNLSYPCQFSTHCFILVYFLKKKAKPCLRSRDSLFSQPLYAYSF